MANREIAKKIIDTENIAAKSFSNFRETDYGMLFYDEANPDSNDANHAIITKYDENTNFDRIAKEIKEFYLSKNLCPRIYSNLVLGQFEKAKDYLLNNGFEIETHDNYYLIHTAECKISEPYTLKIRHINQNDDLSFIFKLFEVKEDRRGGADRVYKTIEKQIKLSNFNMFVGYLENETPVTMAAVEYHNGIAFVDKVRTAEEYRGKSYARQLTKFWVEWHYKNHEDCLLYLLYNNPIAGRIYREAGFTDVDWNFESWSAYIDHAE